MTQEFEKYPKLAATIEWYANNVGVPGSKWNELLREINEALAAKTKIDRDTAEKIWNAGYVRGRADMTGQPFNHHPDKETYLKQFDKQ